MQKRDMIPSEGLLEERRGRILGYWEALLEGFRYRFSREVEVSLLDGVCSGWSLDGVFDCLVGKCRHLVEVRGLSAWRLGDV